MARIINSVIIYFILYKDVARNIFIYFKFKFKYNSFFNIRNRYVTNHEYDQGMSLDQTSFFDAAS